MLKKITLLLLVLLGTNALFAQDTLFNLVKNGGFEQYDTCALQGIKYMYKNRDFPVKDWYNVASTSAPEYFNNHYTGCLPTGTFELGRFKDAAYSLPYKGKAYVGGVPLCLYYNPKGYMYGNNCLPGYMEPIVGALKTPLIKDSLYAVSVAVLCPKTNSFNPKSFSIVLLNDSFSSEQYGNRICDEYKNLFLYLSNKQKEILEFDLLPCIKNRQQWIVYDTIYKAQGGEQYLYLGFYPVLSEAEKQEFRTLIEKEEKRHTPFHKSKLYKLLQEQYTYYKHEADKTPYEFKEPALYFDEIVIKPYRDTK